VTLKKGVSDPALFALLAELPRESVVEVEGTVHRSEKAQRGVELSPSRITVVSRSESPLPLGVVDKVGAELDTRLNHRSIDLRKPAVRAIFELRSALLEELRGAFRRRSFLEIETPKLLREGAEGGATLFAVDYFGTRAYLAQSPQLYKQMLIGAGFERVFEIAPAFRAEPSDTVRHITEFASLDAEMGYIDGPEELRSTLEAVLIEGIGRAREALASRPPAFPIALPEIPGPFPRFSFAAVEEWLGRPGAGRDLSTEDEKLIAERVAKEHPSPFYFVTDYPTEIKRQTFYARRRDDDPSRTMYFDLYYKGLEIASGGPREHRIEPLLANLRGAGLDPEHFAGYLEPFRYGMPPHGGWGLGFDRLVQALAGLANIREARLFPRDRYRLDP
jgi:nondiscriminating aspartyl-tRNA synthetase